MATKVSRQEMEMMELPKVKFSTKELMAKIGLWSGIFYDNDLVDPTTREYYRKMINSNHFLGFRFPKNVADAIKLEFQYVLLCAGIDKDEECFLSDLDRKDFKFQCHLKKAKKDLNVSMTWESIDDLATITLEDDEKKCTFEHIFLKNDKLSEVIPSHYTLKKGDNSCFRFVSGRYAEFTLTNKDDYSLSVYVDRPDYITEPIYDYIYFLNHEKELEEYLLGLSFPVDICEVYKKLVSISLGDAKSYPGINIEARRGKKYTTDRIHLFYGNLLDFIITKEGKRISIDQDGNWGFDTDHISISNAANGSVEYNVHAFSYEDLLEKLHSQNYFVTAQQEVEGMRQYSKSLFPSSVNN